MIRPCHVVNQDVVKKYQDKAAEERPKYVIHQSLKHGQRVAEAERHDQELHFVDVRRPHEHLVVPRSPVQLGEELGTVEFI
jgi:hypothetical protein